jgi:hypothetical protein
MLAGDSLNPHGTIMHAPLMGVAEIRRRQIMSAQDQAVEAAREESMKGKVRWAILHVPLRDLIDGLHHHT